MEKFKMKEIICLVLAAMFLACVSAGCITYENTDDYMSLMEFIDAEETDEYVGYDTCVGMINNVEYYFVGFEDVVVFMTPVNDVES